MLDALCRERVTLTVDGTLVEVPVGTTVVALLAATPSATDAPAGGCRGPWCGMGICFDCRVTIDGRRHQRGCLVVCAEGMEIETNDV